MRDEPGVAPEVAARVRDDVVSYGCGFMFLDGETWWRLDPALVRYFPGVAGRGAALRAVETYASPEPLRGPPKARAGLGGAGAGAGPGSPAEGRGEPRVMASSGGAPGAGGRSGGALVGAVADMMLEFDAQEADEFWSVEYYIGEAWKTKHRRRIIQALHDNAHESGEARVQLLLVLAVGFLILTGVKWVFGG